MVHEQHTGLLASALQSDGRIAAIDRLQLALGAAGARTPVPVGRADLLVEGTRVLRTDLEAARLVDAEAEYLASAADWTRSAGRWSEVTRAAVLDLRVLTHGLPAAVAAWTSPFISPTRSVCRILFSGFGWT